MQPMLGDGRSKGRDLGDLMATRFGIEAIKSLPAFATRLGHMLEDSMKLFGRDHGALMAAMSGLAAPHFARRLARRSPLDARRIGRRRPRRVGGVEVETSLKVGDAALECQILLDQREDQGLKVRRRGIPEIFGDDRGAVHNRRT